MQRRVWVWVFGVIAIAAPAFAVGPVGVKCESAKSQETGKYAACLGKAEAKLIQTAGTCSTTTATTCLGDSDCPMGENCTKDLALYQSLVSKCGAKFAGKWNLLTQKASDAGDPCPDGLASTDIQAVVDQHVARVATGLAGDGLDTNTCGNGAIDAGEDCDLGTLNGGTCISEGFAGGLLRCGPGCGYDVSQCFADRFVDNHDGSITDNATGLTWEKKVGRNSRADLANMHDADNRYGSSGFCTDSYNPCQADLASEVACRAATTGDESGCAQCAAGEGTCDVGVAGTIWQWVTAVNTENFAGHSDWRVPTRAELASILDPSDATAPIVYPAFDGTSCSATCLDVSDPQCSCCPPNDYWTRTSDAAVAGRAWLIGFYDTYPFINTLSSYAAVRAVRGGHQ